MGASVSFSIDAFSFLAIAALISRIEIQTAGYNTPKDAVHQLKSHRPGLVFKSVVFASTWIGTGALFALEAGYAKTYLHASDAVVGWLFACATLGSIFVSKWNRYLGQISTTMKDRIFLFACVGELAFVASYVSVNSVFPALVCIIFYGLLLSLRNILIVSWIHLEIPKAEHGSAFAIQTGLANLAMMLGMGLSGPMAEVFGIRIVVLAAAGFGFVMVVLLNALQAHRENTSDLAEYSDLMCRR
jgi:predicted MFS family arabinose efflux permease